MIQRVLCKFERHKPAIGRCIGCGETHKLAKADLIAYRGEYDLPPDMERLSKTWVEGLDYIHPQLHRTKLVIRPLPAITQPDALRIYYATKPPEVEPAS